MHPLAADLESLLDRHAPLWESLRGTRLFITGGTGFFGCWLLEALAWANDRCGLDISATILTRDPAGFARTAPHLAAHPAFRLHPGDIRSFAFLPEAFDAIVHAATTSAAATFHGEDPLVKFDTVVTGTRRALDFAVHCRARRFLYVSSGSYYGKGIAAGIAEECPIAPDPHDLDAALGHGKRAAEFLCACYAEKHGLKVKIARCFSFVGPYLPLDLHYAVGNFIRDALERDAIVVNGDGTPLRSYLYAADLVTWLLTILTQGSAGRPYNVGSDQSLSIAELAYLVRDTLAPHKAVRILQPPVPGRAPSSYVPDIGRATRELGLRVETPLAIAIRRSADFYRRRATV